MVYVSRVLPVLKPVSLRDVDSVLIFFDCRHLTKTNVIVTNSRLGRNFPLELPSMDTDGVTAQSGVVPPSLRRNKEQGKFRKLE